MYIAVRPTVTLPVAFALGASWYTTAMMSCKMPQTRRPVMRSTRLLPYRTTMQEFAMKATMLMAERTFDIAKGSVTFAIWRK